MWPLLGVAAIVVGVALRLEPLPVVAGGAVLTGLAGGMSPLAVVKALGHAFNESRLVSVPFIVLPVVGLAERAGLQQEARRLVGRLRAMSAGRLLIAYLALRQLSAALGLLALGGQATMVRPLIAPMAQGLGPPAARETLAAHAAAVDNIGAFFGEDIFIALGSVLLIKAVLAQNGAPADPLAIAFWAIPTAAAAFLIHAARLLRLDTRLRAEAPR